MSVAPAFQPDAAVIRLYKKNYARSEASESSYTPSIGEEDTRSEVGEGPDDMSVRLQGHKDYLAAQSTWITEVYKAVETADQRLHDVSLVKRPTASKISHEALNPYVYRQTQRIESLDALATLLKAPDDWERRYEAVVATDHIATLFGMFRRLPQETPEKVVESVFATMVQDVSRCLSMNLLHFYETRIIVGGLLARHDYDVRGATEPHFETYKGTKMIASEVKSAATFSGRDMWYRSSRGVQVLSALYAHNCPTFLLTQAHWKLFVENEERSSVLTFPYDADETPTLHVRSCRVANMGPDFLKAIVICLLSKRHTATESIEQPPSSGTSNADLDKVPAETPFKHMLKDSPAKKGTKLDSQQGGTSSSKRLAPKEPSFISGYADGEPIYSVIRVLSDEAVSRIEEQIVMEEKEEYLKQYLKQQNSSEQTLIGE
jgi:hypothetical protein